MWNGGEKLPATSGHVKFLHDVMSGPLSRGVWPDCVSSAQNLRPYWLGYISLILIYKAFFIFYLYIYLFKSLQDIAFTFTFIHCSKVQVFVFPSDFRIKRVQFGNHYCYVRRLLILFLCNMCKITEHNQIKSAKLL